MKKIFAYLLCICITVLLILQADGSDGVGHLKKIQVDPGIQNGALEKLSIISNSSINQKNDPGVPIFFKNSCSICPLTSPCCAPNSAQSFPTNLTGSPIAMTVLPNGHCVTFLNSSNHFSIFSISSACDLNFVVNHGFVHPPTPTLSTIAYSNSGCLTLDNGSNGGFDLLIALPDSPTCAIQPFLNAYSSSVTPFSVTISPNGNCLAATFAGHDIIESYEFDGSDCQLRNFLGEVHVTKPSRLAFSLDSKCIIAIGGQNNGTISSFTTSSNPCFYDTPVSSLSFQGSSFTALAVSTNCAAVLDAPNNQIRVFTINADSSLTEVCGSPFSNQGSGPVALAYSLSGDCLAVANFESNNVSIFRVNNCALVCQPGSPFNLPVDAKGPIDIKFAAQGCLLTANKITNNVTVFKIPTLSTACWVTGSFITNGRNPLVGRINGCNFGVQRLDVGVYAITLKTPFCCPISVVASSNVGQPRILQTSNSCIILQIPPEADTCATVTFMATPCT